MVICASETAKALKNAATAKMFFILSILSRLRIGTTIDVILKSERRRSSKRFEKSDEKDEKVEEGGGERETEERMDELYLGTREKKKSRKDKDVGPK